MYCPFPFITLKEMNSSPRFYLIVLGISIEILYLLQMIILFSFKIHVTFHFFPSIWVNFQDNTYAKHLPISHFHCTVTAGHHAFDGRGLYLRKIHPELTYRQG